MGLWQLIETAKHLIDDPTPKCEEYHRGIVDLIAAVTPGDAVDARVNAAVYLGLDPRYFE